MLLIYKNKIGKVDLHEMVSKNIEKAVATCSNVQLQRAEKGSLLKHE